MADKVPVKGHTRLQKSGKLVQVNPYFKKTPEGRGSSGLYREGKLNKLNQELLRIEEKFGPHLRRGDFSELQFRLRYVRNLIKQLGGDPDPRNFEPQLSTPTPSPNLSEEEFERQVDLALSAKNVTPAERKKLLPLLKYYREKPHPFTACVRDNRKRFGPLTERYCAVIKDLIVGNTHWRKGRQSVNTSIEINEEALNFCLQLSEEDIQEIINA